MPAIAPEIIAAAKERYAALKATGQREGAFEARRDAAPHIAFPPADNAPRVRDAIPAGRYWHGLVRAGEVLSVSNPTATMGVPMMLWSAADPAERINPPDTIKVQWTAAIGRGRVLISDMGRAMASIIDGPDGGIDCIAPLAATPGAGPDNARDHFIRAAAKHGLSKRDLGPAIALFAPLAVAGDGALAYDTAPPRTGRYDIRAEMDLIVAVANCPHPLAPAEAAAGPVDLLVWRPAAPEAADLCRSATEEAERAFQNTDAYTAGGGR